ncbi:hypothetical protein ACFVTC_08710 [Streptomyces sp. NPDC057950]|uniref:hypothetical protein n=1 Tax=Streptomyces sp. NPDC057950 TaxID=3346288 RepID=UPI0036E4F694
MNADRESDHDMTQGDIAVLLATAADEVRIGPAPCQALVRGGRRRRARRWALAATAALVVAGSTGTLAVAGATGDDAKRVAPAATRPPASDERHLYAPWSSDLARGTEHGKKWKAVIYVWGAPRDRTEAQHQLDAMTDSGFEKPGVQPPTASGLVGKSAYFVRLTLDGTTTTRMRGSFEKGDNAFQQSAAMPLATRRTATSGSDQRLVIGQAPTTAQEVTCTWDDATTTTAYRPSPGTGVGGDFEDLIRPADGSPSDWFVCVGPEGRTFRTVAVTK